MGHGVAIVGAAGYVGKKVVARLLADRRGMERIVAVDIREVPTNERREGIIYIGLDVRSPDLAKRFSEHGVDGVVHLASVVTPPAGMSAQEQYSIDVDGTHNVVEACLTAGVKHLIVVSSGAAYGYHEDNPVPLTEQAPLRGNDEFPYARHKRLVEESLTRYRQVHPELTQLILRPGTILGEKTSNQITDLFLKPVMIGVSGSTSPFVFILDDDVAACIVRGIHEQCAGVFNLAGDGVVTAREIAARMGAFMLELPAYVLRLGLGALRGCRLTRYGPEQVAFLQYRPVLSNAALKRDFGFTPTKTSREVFELWCSARSSSVV